MSKFIEQMCIKWTNEFDQSINYESFLNIQKEKKEKNDPTQFSWYVYLRYLSRFYHLVPYLDLINSTPGIIDETKFLILKEAKYANGYNLTTRTSEQHFLKESQGKIDNYKLIAEHENISIRKAKKAYHILLNLAKQQSPLGYAKKLLYDTNIGGVIQKSKSLKK